MIFHSISLFFLSAIFFLSILKNYIFLFLLTTPYFFTIVRCGWLLKQGGCCLVMWHRRFFILTGNELKVYYEDPRPSSVVVAKSRPTATSYTSISADTFESNEVESDSMNLSLSSLAASPYKTLTFSGSCRVDQVFYMFF